MERITEISFDAIPLVTKGGSAGAGEVDGRATVVIDEIGNWRIDAVTIEIIGVDASNKLYREHVDAPSWAAEIIKAALLSDRLWRWKIEDAVAKAEREAA